MKLVPENPPPGPFRPEFWRSPLRSEWLTSLLGLILLPLILVIALTGLISHDAYHPELAGNDLTSHDLGPLIQFPAGAPSWIYALTQGLHVTVGLITVPVLLAKLWSVIPKLFQWPPVRSAANAVERASLLLLVGGVLFEFATGVLNTQDYYPWHFNFVVAHYWGAWVFFSAFVVHVMVKLPVVARAYRTRNELLHTPGTTPTITRRGLLAAVGGASLTILVANTGESLGGPFRRLALLAPRGRVFGTGPNDFQVNRTAVAAGISAELVGPSWRLTVHGEHTVELTREQLLALPQHTHELTLGCVEGWSTTQRWTGVHLAELARLVGAPATASAFYESVQPGGLYRTAALTADQVSDERTLLALKVNGADLSPDHGYPARVIAAGVPGVHCTKWVGTVRFA